MRSLLHRPSTTTQTQRKKIHWLSELTHWQWVRRPSSNADAGIGIGLNTLVMADAINGIAIGSNARANHANSIAMGNGSQTTRGAPTDYTAYNMDTPQNSVGEFSVGSEDGQRQITNVAAGSADTRCR
ncbi:Hemagglutinin [Salmonella enterica subsp. enterica]|uniref:Hemagglutinin n=1 Tax=Salmonella enterica I TaxID=59201 RepID=A0A447N1W3_SALET|nr:Hemagglutinin [Salmonella enterica subsp. enterica]